ncbi:formate dehydrogenase beta subunit [Pseudonocardia hierapolitana]|uniref:Formate dehydrogenase beta subunit n=1 Tax=Pseudonocardia hierapolitana TaxID=1128676 RepID=A0A561SKQ6_9PSEU|nr:formate dehydrogenase beta subunit [Pseudonocardia hierapolitana]TWF75450.1 formate dehydrogenase beta subunit [Pseudonocardia hierapolitana]
MSGMEAGGAGMGEGKLRVFVPRDSAARSVGADAVAERLVAAGAEVVRTGSRGMLWLEPLVEVETPAGRVGYGPVAPEDVDGLVAAGMLDGQDAGLGGPERPTRRDEMSDSPDGGRVDAASPAIRHGESGVYLGLVEELPWMRRQQRVTFARVGVVDPHSPDDYEANGGLAGLRTALAMSPADVVEEVVTSGLRGRGGAGFPTGIKWRTVLGAEADVKFVCCNADEGDSGTFADRMLIEGDPFTLIEGMTIAAHAVGATEGYVYLRSEYPDAVETLTAAIEAARERGWLGERILGSDLTFDLHVRVGAGAYICGEETSMLESLEGKRGQVRAKPPIPALEGLFGRPTVVNNVLSLASVPAILADGADAYAALGVGRSRGTSVFQLGGNIARGGIVETAFGITLGELIDDLGGGTASGRPARAVQVGGPLGAYLPVEKFDLPMDYEAFAEAGAMLGHGGIVVFDDTVDMAAMARFAFSFCAEESCGKCTPCRVGAVRGVETIDRIRTGQDREKNLVLLEDLCELMTDGSLCAMGGLTPMPVRSAVRHFGEDFTR